MLIRTMNGWALPTHTVRYARDDEVFEQIMGDEGEQWWHDFAQQWPGVRIIEFTALHYTSEQLARLEEIQDIPGSYGEQCEAYVMDGIVPDIPQFAWRRIEDDLLITQEAAAFLYEQNLQLQEENLMALEGIATLYEMMLGGMPE